MIGYIINLADKFGNDIYPTVGKNTSLKKEAMIETIYDRSAHLKTFGLEKRKVDQIYTIYQMFLMDKQVLCEMLEDIMTTHNLV